MSNVDCGVAEVIGGVFRGIARNTMTFLELDGWSLGGSVNMEVLIFLGWFLIEMQKLGGGCISRPYLAQTWG